MKRTFLILILLNVFQNSNSQTLNLEIDEEYFLLGTLSDYMGREKHSKINERLDFYYANDDPHADTILKQYSSKEKSIASYILNTFKRKYSDLHTRTIKPFNRIEILSKSLSTKIDDFYTFKYTGRSAYIRDNDDYDSLSKTEDFRIKNFDSIYTGSLRKDIFKSDLQKLSFLTGMYLRFGGRNDSIYYLSNSNSISKMEESAYLLEELNCSSITYNINKGSVPVGHTVYFQPTNELKKYFETFQYKLETTTN